MQKVLWFILTMFSLPIYSVVTLNEALENEGFCGEQRDALIALLGNTGGLTYDIVGKERSDAKGKSLYELVNNKSNLKDISVTSDNKDLGSLITFHSKDDAKAFLVATTQTLWFRKAWETEQRDNPDALKRWADVDPSKYEFLLGELIDKLGMYSEVKRPETFKPDTIFFLGAIEHAARQRIKGDIPEQYTDDIVVHSNRRGLFLTPQITEPTAISEIAKQLNLLGNKKAYEIIEETCRSHTSFYSVSLDQLEESTRELRKKIINALEDAKLLEDKKGGDFSWPTYKELYRCIFTEAQKAMPKKLERATLTFDDPESLPDGRIHSTESEARSWLQRMKTTHPEKFSSSSKFKVLALSAQPFVAIQQCNLESALHPDCEIVTVGPSVEDTPNTRKDALESLAKIFYEKAKRSDEIKKILPWI